MFIFFHLSFFKNDYIILFLPGICDFVFLLHKFLLCNMYDNTTTWIPHKSKQSGEFRNVWNQRYLGFHHGLKCLTLIIQQKIYILHQPVSIFLAIDANALRCQHWLAKKHILSSAFDNSGIRFFRWNRIISWMSLYPTHLTWDKAYITYKDDFMFFWLMNKCDYTMKISLFFNFLELSMFFLL